MRINFANILYLEPNPTNSHQALLHTVDHRVITVTGTLNELEKQFPTLFRSHRHFLINPTLVVSVNLGNHTLQFKGESRTYPFSRLQTKELLKNLKELNQPFQII